MSTNGIDYGPLHALIGTWIGDRGMDIAPEPDGTEENPFYETIVFTPVGDVTNAERQTLSAVHYRQVVKRKSNDEVFHDQTGYWSWDADSGTLSNAFTIPRGVAVLAGGKAQDRGSESKTVIEVEARADDNTWGVVQSPFMLENARTIKFRLSLNVDGDALTYAQTTTLDIYGRLFEHTDENTLTRQQG